MLAQALTAESGEVDLLIRTGGEKRLSDFLLWESAYAELLFTDRMWPDFDATDLDAALEEFNRRERRFGGVSETTAHSALSGPGVAEGTIRNHPTS
jgi:undecaprenyl diphosphate synthase